MTIQRYKGNKKYISMQVLGEKKQQGTRYKENKERLVLLFPIYSSHHFLHVQTAWSPADFADSRREKTGWIG